MALPSHVVIDRSAQHLPRGLAIVALSEDENNLEITVSYVAADWISAADAKAAIRDYLIDCGWQTAFSGHDFLRCLKTPLGRLEADPNGIRSARQAA